MLVGLAGAMVVPLLELRVGYSVGSFLHSDEPELRAAAAHYDEFAVPDNILLFAYPEPAPFGDAALERQRDLTRALRALPGVERVLALTSAPGLGAGDGERLARRLQRSHVWRDLLVSRGRDALGGVVILDPARGSVAERRRLFSRLEDLQRRRGIDLWLAGLPYQRNEIIRMVRADQLVFLPLCTAITSVLLLWLIPHVVLALLALAVVPFTLIATLGTMALCGIELTLLTSTLPVLLMAMAVADGVHLVGRFVEERRRGLEPSRAAARSLARLLFPCFLTSLTTAIGFLTLTLATIPDLRHMGLFAAVGVGFAYVFTVLVMPAALSMVRGMPGRRPFDLPAAVARLAARAALARPAAVLAPAAALLLVGGWAALQVRRDHSLRVDLWPDSETARDLDEYERRFVGMTPSEVLATSRRGFDDPRARAQLALLVDWLETLPEVSRALSLVDLARDGVPDALLAGVARTAGLLTRDGRTARVLAFQGDSGTAYLRRFRALVGAKDGELPALDVRVAGVQVVAMTLVDRLTVTLGRSFLGSLAVILLLIWGLFRSLRLGLIAVAPNLFPLMLNLAFMSATGIALRPLTVITFCIAFGLAVDDTVHLLARYREERAAGRGREPALAATLATAGRPVVITTMLLLTGFAIILTSSFKGTFQFGALVSLALLGSLLGALLLLPALLRVTEGWGLISRTAAATPPRSSA